jgi:PAS domain S-box-containing protein
VAIAILQDNKIKYANQAASDISGYSLDELLSWKSGGFVNIIHPEDRDFVIEQARKKQKGEKEDIVTSYPFIIITKKGKTKWMELYSKTVTYEGRLADFMTMIDITGRKQAEEDLRLMQFSLEHTKDSAFWMGPDAKFIYVNDAACQLSGYTRKELLNMTVHDIDPNFPKKVWKKHWNEVKKQGSFTIESAHRKKNGDEFPVEISVNYMEFEGEEYNFAFARDITERKKAEEAIQEREARFSSFAENSFDIIYMMDEKGMLNYVSPAITRILGFEPKEVIGKALESFLPETEQYKGMKIRNNFLKGVNFEGLEIKLLGKDKSILDFEINGNPIYRDKEIIGFQGIGDRKGYLGPKTVRRGYEKKVDEIQS